MDSPFVAVARAADIPSGGFTKVEIAGRAFLVAHVGEDWYAVEDLCSHEDFPLSYGCLEGGRIKCSLHGSRFDLKSGRPLEEPADTPIATYRVALADGQVWLDPTAPTNRG
ncbi:Rieske (2Fe-2S) protein [Thiococcus pfennigii]|uniref:Rieske (2Fe-2S) protein n=1 Tax=Thiococcus pfennigii TaxID=1057 RepID=UPI001908F6E5|nr:non-heme iron oxygenase ferredoxin subunit [Thiococcus pfennigii]MBK1731368.1 (2Fe-2S)-binding protein [Thiococcus pfennigii]